MLPWRKYDDQKRSMEFLTDSIFQENISDIFVGFDTVYSYMENVLVITKNDFSGHLNNMEKVSQKLVKEVLKVMA